MAQYVITPPVEPMLAKLAEALPAAEGFLFEPKWDGFRALVFRGEAELFIQSRDLRPFDRYFPELHAALLERLPPGCVLDGEIVIATPHGLDFDALQMRLHPAASRVAKLAKEMASSFVAFDALAVENQNVMSMRQDERRALLERLLEKAKAPLHLTPMTHSRETAADWLQRFEGAGLDGVIAKPAHLPYQPGKRSMLKVKHARSADCVVAGMRWHKSGRDTVGSLLLGLYDERGELHHVGVTSSFTMAKRRQLAKELQHLQTGIENHPWENKDVGSRSRWSAGKDLSWQPLRPQRVCEVKYDHMQGERFRHAAVFLRWRPDKAPAECRYDQLEVSGAYELSKVFGATAARA